MKKVNSNPDKNLVIEQNKNLTPKDRRQRTQALRFTPNMDAARRSNYEFKAITNYINQEDESRETKHQRISEESHPLEPADYIKIRWDHHKWYPATILEMLPPNQMLVCYDDGEFAIENIEEIRFKHISKQPASDDLFFKHDNGVEYFIPKGVCSVIKVLNIELAEDTSRLDSLTKAALTPGLDILANAATASQISDNSSDLDLILELPKHMRLGV